MEKILDLSKVPKEVLLILEFLKEESDILTQKRLANEVDWQLFIDYSVHHRVYPLLYRNLSKLEENLVPDLVLETLRELYKKNTFKMLQLTGEMNFINELLYQNGIHVIFLKGPILARDLYGDTCLRTSGDLDFLIQINQLDKTERILIANGYIIKDNFSRIFNDWKFRRHHVTFFHPTKKTTLEIHWRLHPRPIKEVKFSDLWNRKRSDNISSTLIHHLGLEDLFQYLTIHGSRHGWYRLRWLIDLQKLLVNRTDNKDNILTITKRNNLPLNQMLILLNELLDENLRKEGSPTFNKNSKVFAQKTIFYLEKKENLHSPDGSKELKKFHRQYSSSALTFSAKIFEVISKFYPLSDDSMTLNLPRYLHWIYIPLRPLLAIHRKLRKSLIGSIK